MTATAQWEPEQRLEQVEVELAEVIREWAADASALSPTADLETSVRPFADRMSDTVDRLLSINGKLYEDDFDPRALAEFRGVLIDTLQAARRADPDRPLDSLDTLLVQTEQLRHIVRDALDGHVDGRNASELLSEIRAWLPDARLKDLGMLVGRSDRQVQRWAASDAPAPRRLRLVARLVAVLRQGWAAQGVVAWFTRSRVDLGGRTPLEALDDPNLEPDLLSAARGGRAQHGG